MLRSFGPWAIHRSPSAAAAAHAAVRLIRAPSSVSDGTEPPSTHPPERACPTMTIMAAAAAISALLPRAAAVRIVAPRARPAAAAAASRLLCAAAAGEASSSPPAPRRLVLYTKPGCCLCDGLKEKLHAAVLLAGTPYSLASLELQASKPRTSP
ncbi:Glutaredoxin-like protein [Hordeum vulgare]|nr:Glutaredoxin-like protein [Hordeum vulgare]